MSLFLGKIHYWLFNKILWFEGLEDELVKLAKKEGLDIDTIENNINLKYGKKLSNKNLEEIIDKSNIHGWLQNRIHSSEGRMAAWTHYILEDGTDKIEKLEEIYIDQGNKASKEVKANKDVTNAKEIYDSINDYILDGMPCDRVNEIIVQEENRVKWKKRICVHKEIWEEENVDVNIFYNLRNLWIKSFVNGVNSNFKYSVKENGEYCID